jgi:hypothetical protein
VVYLFHLIATNIIIIMIPAQNNKLLIPSAAAVGSNGYYCEAHSSKWPCASSPVNVWLGPSLSLMHWIILTVQLLVALSVDVPDIVSSFVSLQWQNLFILYTSNLWQNYCYNKWLGVIKEIYYISLIHDCVFCLSIISKRSNQLEEKLLSNECMTRSPIFYPSCTVTSFLISKLFPEFSSVILYVII